MKKIFVAIIVTMFLVPCFAHAEDEATLKMKAELYQERLARIEAQSIIMQQQYIEAKAALESIKKQLEKTNKETSK
jgi:hypothetical protein